ncbi:MAG: gliding motility-associated C-terminal domain-containing protein [Vicingaceae bacterium]|nr:gliding motility-associated C-terminal domain-containing protein [Vicingaceae bacterium]
MKKYISLVFLIIGGYNLVLAQCPATIQINRTPEDPVCKNTPVTYTISPSAGGITNYIWVVNGDTVSNLPSITTSINFAHVEIYAVSDTCNLDTMYADDNIDNVILSAEYNVIIEECNQTVADVEILSISGGKEPYSYNLYTGAGGLGQQTIYIDVPVSSYPLVIEDDNGCIDTVWVDMAALECPPPLPTQVITPNGDGYNDMWRIQFIELYPNNEVFIYDRWGQRVYHKKEYTNAEGWEAKYIGSDMPVSTYYYILKIKYEKKDEEVFNGPISVFR